MEPNRRARGHSSSERGGAGSAIAIELLQSGVRELVIHDADESRVAILLDLLKDLGQGRVSAGPPDPTGCDLVCNATPLRMEDGDSLPVDAALLTSSMFVGDVIAGHGVTPFLEVAEAAGCKTANGAHMVQAAQDVMADFMLQTADTSKG
jgi:shikimate dehydrogenase